MSTVAADPFTDFIPEIWGSRFTEILFRTNDTIRLVDRRWEGDLRTSRTVSLPHIIYAIKAPGVPESEIGFGDLFPERFQVEGEDYFAFEVDDVKAAQESCRVMDSCLEGAVAAIGAAADRAILGVHARAGTRLGEDRPIVLRSPSDLVSLFARVAEGMDAAKSRRVPARWAVIDPDTADLLPGGKMIADELGSRFMLDDFVVHVTPHVPQDDTSKTLVFGELEAIHYASQVTKMETLKFKDTGKFAGKFAVRGTLVHGTHVSDGSAHRLASVKVKSA